MNIVVEVRLDRLNIYLNDILHLRLYYPDILGMQSWIDDSGYKFIRYYLKGNSRVTCKYAEVEDWENILKQLNEVL
jgi:hypothetical protein